MSSVLLWVIAILAVVIPLLAVALSAVPYLRAPSGKRVGPTTPAGPAAPALNIDWRWVGYPVLATAAVAAIAAAAYWGWGVGLPSWMTDINWWKVLLVVAAIAAIIVAFYLLRALWRWWQAPAVQAPARTAWFPWKTVLVLGVLAALVFLPPWSEWMSKVQLTADTAASVLAGGNCTEKLLESVPINSKGTTVPNCQLNFSTSKGCVMVLGTVGEPVKVCAGQKIAWAKGFRALKVWAVPIAAGASAEAELVAALCPFGRPYWNGRCVASAVERRASN